MFCTMKIQLFDGIVPVLENFWHILDLCQSLFSLDYMEVNGCTLRAKNKVFKLGNGFLGDEAGTSMSKYLSSWSKHCDRWS